jgi:glucokinase
VAQPPKALLADIGGTNARFALMDGTAHGPPMVLPVAGFATIEDAVATALNALAPEGGVERAVLALAGPVLEEPVRLTNATWEISSAALAARFGFRRVRLVNDFLAQAQALPWLGPADLSPIGPGLRAPGAPMLVLGAGTGLGVAGFLPETGMAMPTEGGHIGLAPTDAREDAVVAALRARCGRAGAEEALSGRGLGNLHAVLAGLRSADVPERDAPDILDAAETCPVAAETIELFLGFLAGTAGDLALAWGARGGVFLSGGIVPRLIGRIEPRAFRTRFEAKAPMQGWMAGIPLAVVTHPNPAFLGLAALARLTEA